MHDDDNDDDDMTTAGAVCRCYYLIVFPCFLISTMIQPSPTVPVRADGSGACPALTFPAGADEDGTTFHEAFATKQRALAWDATVDIGTVVVGAEAGAGQTAAVPAVDSCTDFSDRLRTVGAACCDTAHPCIGGLPTACGTRACAAVLLPLRRDCASSLTASGFAAGALDDAAAGCTAPVLQGGFEGSGARFVVDGCGWASPYVKNQHIKLLDRAGQLVGSIDRGSQPEPEPSQLPPSWSFKIHDCTGSLLYTVSEEGSLLRGADLVAKDAQGRLVALSSYDWAQPPPVGTDHKLALTAPLADGGEGGGSGVVLGRATATAAAPGGSREWRLYADGDGHSITHQDVSLLLGAIAAYKTWHDPVDSDGTSEAQPFHGRCTGPTLLFESVGLPLLGLLLAKACCGCFTLASWCAERAGDRSRRVRLESRPIGEEALALAWGALAEAGNSPAASAAPAACTVKNPICITGYPEAEAEAAAAAVVFGGGSAGNAGADERLPPNPQWDAWVARCVASGQAFVPVDCRRFPDREMSKMMAL
eukprot:SAG11_NODE_913_length_6579_cov_3.562963_2_plen_535_part_00